MKIASWNVNSLKIRLPHLQQWCADAAPDIVALQETKLEDGQFPREAIETLGYHAVFNGQRTYNGVALLSKTPIEDAVNEIDGFEDVQRRFLAASVGDLRIVNLYVVNGQAVGSEKYDYKLRWLQAGPDCARRFQHRSRRSRRARSRRLARTDFMFNTGT